MHYLSCAVIDYTSRVRVVYKAGWGCRENSIKHLSRANHPNYDGLLLCYWQVFKKKRHFTVAIEDNIEWVHVPHDVKLF